MNILFSYSRDEDLTFNEEGHIFLGAGEDVKGGEVHLFLKKNEDLPVESVTKISKIVNGMFFKVGHYYKHSGGELIHVVGASNTTMYGWALVAESNLDCNLKPIGQGADNAVNWTEIEEAEWNASFDKP